MLNISVTSDLERQISQWARIAGDQVPFATALALTRTAKAAKEEIERQLPSLIDKPTAFTMRGFRLWPANKRTLVAVVDFRQSMTGGASAKDYLSALVYGGPRKIKNFERSLQRAGLLPSGYMAVPGAAAKIDGYGNMSRAQIGQVLAAVGAAKAKAKRATARYFVIKDKQSHLPPGIWMTSSKGAVQPVIMYVKKPAYRATLDVPGIAKRVIDARFATELQAAMQQALASRK